MKILISPPMRFGNYFTGAARRTLEVYNRLGEEVYLCVDWDTFSLVDEEVKPLLSSFHVVKSYSVSRVKYLLGFLNCLKTARKADFILSYSEFSLSVLYSYLLSLLSGKPLIIFVHHVTEELRSGNKLLRRAFNRSLGIITLDNEEVVEELRRMFPEKKILTSTNGVNTDLYFTSEEKICDGLFIGNYGVRKGVNYLDKIWKFVNAKGGRKLTLCILW
ncbi:glycosyltransferase [Sulfolobus sp. E11-6]|uniref:glycosyltransferase n=1 Tax=Sulfolobus sp. E11-6 TaxID=2663020 RepID=UPI001EECAC5F|nr:glycosyltransferase [Sulfolobus sp. E11-6]